MKIVILGGGPAGLGAAWRLDEIGHDDYAVFEARDRWGGLSASCTDPEGFVWDFGGHVLFSHYRYFDRVMDQVLGDTEWLVHHREAWIYMQDRFVPYPLQNHIHHLPPSVYWECLEGIIDNTRHPARSTPAHFGEWIEMTFGRGLAGYFLYPYNKKVWAWPPEEMGWNWVGERVAPVDLKAVLKNAVFENSAAAWGPNATFRFPRTGGTGRIWQQAARTLPDSRMHLHAKAIGIDTDRRQVTFDDGTREAYDILFSTLPLTHLAGLTGLDERHPDIRRLKHSATHVVGLAMAGAVPDVLKTKCWIYFPEDNCPFYRVTVFSNYAPANVPNPGKQWSLMCEVSESAVKKEDPSRLADQVIQGALNTGLVRNRNEISHTWYQFEEKGYPTPCTRRNRLTDPLLVDLEALGIYSRGRFGAWKYEVGNMDHSFMQGVEFVNHVLAAGEELTVWYPGVVNSGHPSGRKR